MLRELSLMIHGKVAVTIVASLKPSSDISSGFQYTIIHA
jgi:hypothetical protein